MATNSEPLEVTDLKALVLELEAYRGEDIIDRVHDFLTRLLERAMGSVPVPGDKRGRFVTAELLAYIQQHALPNPAVNHLIGGIDHAKNPYWQNKRQALTGLLSDEEKQKLMQAVPQAVVHVQSPQKTVRLEGRFSIPIMSEKADPREVEARGANAVHALAEKMIREGLIKAPEHVGRNPNTFADEYRIAVEVVVP